MIELATKMKEIGSFESTIEFMEHSEFYGDSYEDIGRRVPDVSK